MLTFNTFHYRVKKDLNGAPNDVANNYTVSYFTDALFAEVFKLIPVQWLGYPCLRVDVLQCQGKMDNGISLPCIH